MSRQDTTGFARTDFIAVHGLKRCGKGSISSYLAEHHGFEVLKFATPLKDMTTALLSRAGYSPALIERCIESDLKEVALPGLGGLTSRRVMQIVGSEFRFEFAPRVWVSLAQDAQERICEAGGRVVLDDLRFPDFEMDYVQKAGATLWVVNRPTVPAERAPSDIDEVLDAVSTPMLLDEGALGCMMDVFVQAVLGCGPFIAMRQDREPLRLLSGASLNDAWTALRKLPQMLAHRPPAASPDARDRHVSEMGIGLESFHHEFTNDDTLDHLREQVREQLAQLDRARGLEPTALGVYAA